MALDDTFDRSSRARPHDKRTHLLPAIRVAEPLEVTLMRLATQNDRTLSDYMRHVLERHCFGHALSVCDAQDDGNQSRG